MDINTITNVLTPSGSQGLTANGFLFVLVALTMLGLMWVYLKWVREKRNPYFMHCLTFQHKYFVKVEYFKQFGKSFLEDGEEVCAYGEKGVYFTRLDKLIPVSQKMFINGKNKKMKFVITDTGLGYPIMLVEEISPELPCTFEELKAGNYDELKLRNFFDNYDRWLKVAKAADGSYDLLLSQHVDSLYDNVQKQADDDKTWNERMMEAAPQFMLIGIIALSFLLNMYFVNQTLVETNGQNAALLGQVTDLYKIQLEQQMYCTTFISKYGNIAERAEWENFLNKNGPPSTG